LNIIIYISREWFTLEVMDNVLSTLDRQTNFIIEFPKIGSII